MSSQLSHARANMATMTLRRFLFMAAMFSLNHGSAVACLSFAVAQLGAAVGNASSGSLYFAFMITALFGSAAIVRRIGAKGGLVLGTFLYSAYVLSFVIAATMARHGVSTEGSVVWAVAIAGGVLGGVAAGILLTASGTYFSYASRDYANRPGYSGTFKSSTTKLSGYLAAVFVGTEVVCKLLASLLVYVTSTWIWMAIFFLALSLVSAIGMTQASSVHAFTKPTGDNGENDAGSYAATALTIDEKDESHDDNGPSSAVEDVGEVTFQSQLRDSDAGYVSPSSGPPLVSMASVAQVIAQWLNDPRLLLAGGINLAFGFCSAYVTSYLNGIVVKGEYGGSAVGLFASITPAVSGIAALPIAVLARRMGTKTPFMVLASLAAGSIALLGLFLSSAELGDLGVLLAVYALEGIIRCIFEGINKGVYADLFLGESEVAFATLIVQSGGASAIAFWLMSVRFDQRIVAACTLVAAAIAMPMFWCAKRMKPPRSKHMAGFDASSEQPYQNCGELLNEDHLKHAREDGFAPVVVPPTGVD